MRKALPQLNGRVDAAFCQAEKVAVWNTTGKDGMNPESSYDERYGAQEFHWGTKPSAICHKVLALKPPNQTLSLLDIGCGEGRNAVFFAHRGYEVTAFDLSAAGVAKAERLAEAANATLRVFQANMNEHRLEENFDVLFSTGVFHLIPRRLRQDIFSHYKEQTLTGGFNVFSVFVRSRLSAERRIAIRARSPGCRVNSSRSTMTGRLSTALKRYLTACQAAFRISTQ